MGILYFMVNCEMNQWKQKKKHCGVHLAQNQWYSVTFLEGGN